MITGIEAQEIIDAAIHRAIQNGWAHEPISEVPDGVSWLNEPYLLIYRHDFAKALWGEKETYDFFDIEYKLLGYKVHRPYTAWKYHLMMMVLSDDPIEYLGETLL